MTMASIEATPVEATHLGIVYPGEYVRAATWQPSLGQPLTANVYFRVVFLDTPTDVFPTSLQDHRIAVFVPGRKSRELERAEIELRAIREATATYAIGIADIERHDAEDRAVAAWQWSFRDGQLISAPPLDADLQELFADGYWSQWAERIGTLLLQRAYPDLPFNHRSLRVPIEPDSDVPIMFDAFIDPSGPAETFALDTFGPALGLSAALAPRIPNLQRRPWLDRLESMISGGWEPSAIGHALAHEQGLTYPLATLFLLLWASQLDHAITLKPGHRLASHDGSLFTADLIDAGNLRELRWPVGLWERIGAIGEPLDDTTDPLLAALAGTSYGDVTAAAERQLANIREHYGQDSAAIAALAESIGAEPPTAELGLIAALRDADSVDQARSAGDAAAFESALRLWRLWDANIGLVPALIDGRKWVDGAAPVDPDTDHDALSARLSAPTLVTSPQGWPALVESLTLFQQRYAERYTREHSAFHTEMAHLAHVADEVLRKARALATLNRIPELGEPVGVGLDGLAEEAWDAISACGEEPSVKELMASPRCRTCGMQRGTRLPASDLRQIAEYVDDALGVQNRRLATLIAHRLVDRDSVEHVDRFLQVVQASDLAGLATCWTIRSQGSSRTCCETEGMASVLDWLTGKRKGGPKEPPLLLVGIGNPGPKYDGTRHNIGFRCIDLLAERHAINLNDKRKDVVLGQGTIAGVQVVLAKPRTFVNKSGIAARYLASRFGTRPSGMLVLIDDLDLPVGKMRLRGSGGSGGHNGLNSINADLGSQEYPRLRVGISRPSEGAIAHVLGGFSKEEEAILQETLPKAVEAAEAWVEHGIDYAMNHFN